MTHSTPRSTVLAVLACLALTATAVVAKSPKHATTAPAVDGVDIAALLPDPPMAGSAEARAELDAVLAAQAVRTPADIARARATVKFDVFAFADAVGRPGFDADHCPQTAALFKSIEKQAKAACNVGKAHWNRRRPPFVDDRIKLVVPLEDEGSYPSSHAARGQLYAEVLAAVLPADRRDAIMARGQQIGYDRVVGGVHYPSDVTAGRTLGHALANKLLADPGFRSRLEGVRVELAKLSDISAAH